MTLTTSTATSHELIRFLLARIDDDETALKRLARRAEKPGSPAEGPLTPARMQAELATQRKVIGHLQQLLVLRDQPAEKAVRDHALQMLRLLAATHAAHPGYRSEWRPSGAH